MLSRQLLLLTVLPYAKRMKVEIFVRNHTYVGALGAYQFWRWPDTC
jgi:hypothetical protein